MLELADLHLALRLVHIVAGTLGLAMFWTAVVAKKGATTHIRSGRVFVWCAYSVGITAVFSAGWALADPFRFGTSSGSPAEDIKQLVPDWHVLFSVLGLAGLSLLAYVQVGVYAVKRKNRPGAVGAGVLIVLLATFGLVGAGMAVVGITSAREVGPGIHNVLPAILGAGAVPLAYSLLRFVCLPTQSHMAWWYKHMECMLVSGIIFHTALAVTISFRLMQQGLLAGPLGLVPWLMPTVIGAPATWLWCRHYKVKFGKEGQDAEEGDTADNRS